LTTMKQQRGLPHVYARTADGRAIQANGREGETLIGLVEKGHRGLRAYDFAGGPPFRLAAYVFDLKGMGLAIQTRREAHGTGWHGVYVLETPVAILKVEGLARKSTP
jgi:hypothetical protein